MTSGCDRPLFVPFPTLQQGFDFAVNPADAVGPAPDFKAWDVHFPGRRGLIEAQGLQGGTELSGVHWESSSLSIS